MRRIAIVGLAFFLAGCNGGVVGTSTTAPALPPATDPPPTSQPSPTTSTPQVTTTSSQPSGVTLQVVASALGDILADANGNTLYLFTPDAQGESTCYGQCEQNWPPFTGEASAGAGIDASLVGSVARNDGSLQVTYNGWPLYYFAGDSAPGDTNGQGLNGIWFVVSASGDAIP